MRLDGLRETDKAGYSTYNINALISGHTNFGALCTKINTNNTHDEKEKCLGIKNWYAVIKQKGKARWFWLQRSGAAGRLIERR